MAIDLRGDIPRGIGWVWKTAGLIPLWFMYAQSIPLPFGPPTVEPDLIFGLTATMITSLAISLSLVGFALALRAALKRSPAGTPAAGPLGAASPGAGGRAAKLWRRTETGSVILVMQAS